MHFATWFAEKGYNLILHYNTSEKEVVKLKEKLECDYSLCCFLWKADLKEDFLPSLTEVIENNNLYIDALVNNVGNFLYKPITEISDADMYDVMSTNFQSAMSLCGFLIPKMLEKGRGHIINLTCSGVEGLVYRKNTAFYHYAKSGVHLLTQMWAQELAGTTVTINNIAPGVLPDSVYKDTISEKYWTSFAAIKQAFLFIIENETLPNGITIDLAKGWKPGCGT